LLASGVILRISIVSKSLVGLIAFVFISTAAAHSFNLVFIAPFTKVSGKSALNGFLLATREQDSHENEESDGHLGGLDSYIFKVDNMKGEAALLQQVGDTIRKSKPLFATGLDLNDATLNLLENKAVVVVDPMASGFWTSLTVAPGRLKLMDGENFGNAFRRAYGYDPDLQAMHGYLAARIIATVVRNSDNLAREDPGELKQALYEVLAKPQL
jgi:hypothetical protein